MHIPLKIGAFTKTVILVAVLSVIGNVVLNYVGILFSHPPATFAPYMYTSVIELTVAGVLAAAVVYGLMRRFIADTAKANTYFIWLSIVVLIVSFYPDIALPWSTDADEVGWTYGIMANLMLMHVVAGMLVMWLFTKTKKEPAPLGVSV